MKTSECTYFQLARIDVPSVVQVTTLVCVPCNLVMLIVMDAFQNIYFTILNQLVNPSSVESSDTTPTRGQNAFAAVVQNAGQIAARHRISEH